MFGTGRQKNGWTGLEAIVTDYDRTLTDDNLIAYGPALNILRIFQNKKGMKVVIATGRSISYIHSEQAVFRFADAVVAENGAVIWIPEDGRIKSIGDGSRTKAAFHSSAIPFEQGDVIISVNREYETHVRRTMKRARLRVDVQYNQDSMMIMPKGVDKATGVKIALKLLRIPSAHLVCIGDGENDLPLFKIAKLRVATEGSVQVLKDQSDVICDGPCAIGVTRFLEILLKGTI